MPDPIIHSHIFRETGWVVVPKVIPADCILQMSEFLTREICSITTNMQARFFEDLPTLFERFNQNPMDLDGLDKTTRDLVTGHFPLAVRLSEMLWSIPRLPVVQELLRSLLETNDLFMHMPPMARWIHPGNRNAAVPVHQDLSYNPQMDSFVTLWVPLVEIDSVCGGVAVYPGTGTLPLLPIGEAKGGWFAGCETKGFEAHHCLMQPGDVLALNPYLLHQSMPNQSDHTRISIDFRFFGKDHHSTKHFLDMQSWTVVAPSPIESVL